MAREFRALCRSDRNDRVLVLCFLVWRLGFIMVVRTNIDAAPSGMVGLGTTTFTEKVKNYSGFSPLNYLITIRISEAIKLLKQNGLSVTDIALDTGFYSSQHFSTTFKKLTGYTPSDFRKKNISHGQD